MAKLAKRDPETHDDILVLLPTVEGTGGAGHLHMRCLGYMGSFLLQYSSAQVRYSRAGGLGGCVGAGNVVPPCCAPLPSGILLRPYGDQSRCIPLITPASAPGARSPFSGCATSCSRKALIPELTASWRWRQIRASRLLAAAAVAWGAAARCAAAPCTCFQVGLEAHRGWGLTCAAA